LGSIKLIPPVTYQGGKQRIASQIIDQINPSSQTFFYDLCCGSGSISIELANRGYLPSKIYMLDKSPWGIFWQMVGNGGFDLSKFAAYCDSVPKNRSDIKSFMQELFDKPINGDFVYIFLLLQAGTFGGAAVWTEDGKWKKSGGFRNYWIPTEKSNRRSPVNPMMPLPGTLFYRVEQICKSMFGVTGHYGDIYEILPENGIVYIDPPYHGTAFYGHSFNVLGYVSAIRAKCFISEAVPLSAKSHLISTGFKKGGMSGRRQSLHEEWVSEFN